jgi:hypothetical protein
VVEQTALRDLELDALHRQPNRFDPIQQQPGDPGSLELAR